MKLSARSFPHPVLGNRDDVPDVAFQSTIEMTADKENIYLDVRWVCSSATLMDYIGDGRATVTVHVECSNTMYRAVHYTKDAEARLAIRTDLLNDSVEVNTFITALTDINGYSIPGCHSDYGTATFDIKKGDILAVSEGYVFHIESQFDAMNRIGAIMSIVESQLDGDRPMQPDFGQEKIIVVLSKPDFSDYKLMRSQEAVAGPLTCAIVLPVLVEALRQVAAEGADESSPRWMRVLQRRAEASGVKLSEESDFIALAQSLLELPLRRALVSAKQFAENAS